MELRGRLELGGRAIFLTKLNSWGCFCALKDSVSFFSQLLPIASMSHSKLFFSSRHSLLWKVVEYFSHLKQAKSKAFKGSMAKEQKATEMVKIYQRGNIFLLLFPSAICPPPCPLTILVTSYVIDFFRVKLLKFWSQHGAEFPGGSGGKHGKGEVRKREHQHYGQNRS